MAGNNEIPKLLGLNSPGRESIKRFRNVGYEDQNKKLDGFVFVVIVLSFVQN
jgi:hypothetical protein